MKRFFILFALFCALTVPAFGTDITISAMQQTALSFNPSNIGTDRSITVSVTNGSATVTSSAAFPAAIVGIAGFQVSIGGTQYVVASVASTSSLTLTTNYSGSTGSATMILYRYVLLRAYATQGFQPLGAAYVVQPGAPGSGNYFLQVACSVINTGSGNVLYTPSFSLPATTDALITNNARYIFGYYRADGSFLNFYTCGSRSELQLPTTTPTTWTAICAWNSAGGIVPPNATYYTAAQIDARFPSCTSQQLLYFAATGNALTCLTLGTGLSITGSTLNASGGGGGSGASPPAASIQYNDGSNNLLGNAALTFTSGTATVNIGTASSLSGKILLRNATNSNTLTLQPGATSANITYTLPVSDATYANQVLKSNAGGTLSFGGGLREVINVKLDYGCAGDNSTNDTTCIANAMTAAATTTNKALYFPAGTYLSDPISTSGNSILIFGDGPAHSIIKSRTNGALLTFDNSATTTHSITIRDISFQGFGSGSGNNGIVISGANDRFNYKLSNVRFTNFAGTTILSSGGTLFTSTFEDVDIDQPSGASGHAFDLLGAQTNTLIRTYVHNVATNMSAYRLRSGSWTLIGANGIDSGTNANWGIFGQQTSDDGTDTYSQVTFIGSNVEDWSATDGVIFRIGSVGSFYNTKFDTLSSGTYRAIKMNYVDVGFSGIFDAESGFLLNGTAAWTNSLPVHSYNPPFVQIGSREMASYYDTALATSVSFSAITNNLNGASSRATTHINRLSLDSTSTFGLDSHLMLASDNTYDVGATGGQRPRTVYAATSFQLADGTTYIDGQNWRITGGANPILELDDATTTGRLQLLTAGGGIQLLTTSAHPLLLGANGTAAWSINSSNNLIVTSGSRTIGLAAGNRPTIVYASTSLNAGTPGVTTGSLVFGNASNANTFTLQSGVTGSSLTFTLPTADGSASDCLKTNGSGVLSFSSCGTSLAWSALTAPAASLSLAHATYNTAFTWGGNYGSSPAFDMQATDTSATGALLRLRTAVATLMPPLVVEPRTGQSLKADHLRNVVIGKDAPGNTDTDGYPYLPVLTGTNDPSGTPTTHSGYGPVLLRSNSVGGTYSIWGYLNGSWRNLTGSTGAPALTATYIGYGDGSNLMTGSANFTWNESTKVLTLANSSGTGFIDVKGASNSGAVRMQGATHPNQGGGLILPYVGGSQSAGPGVWWSDGTYANTVGLWLASGLNFQGDGGNPSVILRKSTDSSSNGSVVFTLNPDAGTYTQAVAAGNTSSVFDGQTFDISSTGTAAAGFGFGRLVNLENGAGSQIGAGRISVAWTVATASSETSKVAISTASAGSSLAESFIVEADQYYGQHHSQGNVSGAVTFDFNNGNFISVTVTGNITSTTLSNLRAGGRYIIRFTQDATGGRTWTPPTGMKFPGGVAGNFLTGSVNAVDVAVCDASDSSTLWCQFLADVKNP